MVQHLLVPLDGSHCAEEVIPVAARIARASGSRITLLHVVSPGHVAPHFHVPGEATVVATVQAHMAAMHRSLVEIAQMDVFLNVRPQVQVIMGEPVERILAYAQDQHVDLLVLCRHGQSRPHPGSCGQVAQQVIRQGVTPVLLLPESHARLSALLPKSPEPLHALVALDGSAFAEATLRPTADLMAALAAPAQGVLHVMRIVTWPAFEAMLEWKRFGRHSTIEQVALDEAASYLQAVSEHLAKEIQESLPMRIIWSVYEGEDVATTLVKAAEPDTRRRIGNACCLIALATHGRRGLQRWALGSVTERVLSETDLPLLIVRPQERGTVTGDVQPHRRQE